MRYKKMIYRITAFVMIISMLMVSVAPQQAQAKTIDKIIEQVGGNLVDDGVVLTKLSPNTSQD